MSAEVWRDFEKVNAHGHTLMLLFEDLVGDF
jgi:hypothetical protein